MELPQSKKILEIIKDGNVNSSFFKANRFLINTYKENLINLSDKEKKEFIKNLWSEHFYAKIINSTDNTDSWTHLEFSSEKDMMLFLMKWNT
jgi:hypothetical protein